MPKRIQRRRTKGWRMPEGAIYVGRPSRWGNPFKVGDELGNVPALAVIAAGYTELPADYKLTPEMVIRLFRVWAKKNLDCELLRGKDLACWCPEDAEWCHANELLEMANLPDAARGEG